MYAWIEACRTAQEAARNAQHDWYAIELLDGSYETAETMSFMLRLRSFKIRTCHPDGSYTEQRARTPS